MGYTQHWVFKKSPKDIENGKEKFANAVANFKKGLEKLQDIALGNGWGLGEPTITDTKIWFNGKVPEDYEFCSMSIESEGYNFCKTQYRPYDSAVCLLLLCMANEFGDDFEYESDDKSMTEEGWVRAKEIFAEL